MTVAPAVAVDTNVLSFFLKEPPHTRAIGYEPLLDGHTLVVSFMVVAELWRGAEEAGWGEMRRAKLRAYLHRYIVDPFDPGLCEAWARLMAMSRKGGHNISQADAWVAVTA